MTMHLIVDFGTYYHLSDTYPHWYGPAYSGYRRKYVRNSIKRGYPSVTRYARSMWGGKDVRIKALPKQRAELTDYDKEFKEVIGLLLRATK